MLKLLTLSLLSARISAPASYFSPANRSASYSFLLDLALDNKPNTSDRGVYSIAKAMRPIWKLGVVAPSDSERNGREIKNESMNNIKPVWSIDKIILVSVCFFL